MIDVFGQELYMYLQSPVWQERDQALQQIISAIEELVKRDQAQLALNQVVFLLSFQEKNQQVQLKYLQLYLHLAQQSAFFKFDNVVKVIAYVLDKLVDQRFEKQADSTYRAFLTRN
jgi:anaerobic ribonucleoside-triphosphate reductase